MNFVAFLTNALKSRIQTDMEEGQFPVVGWELVPLGTYYFSTDPQTSVIVIHKVVREVLEGALAVFGLMILDDAWRRLLQGITAATTPAAALDRMRDAASTAIPLPPAVAVGPVDLPFAREATLTPRPDPSAEARENEKKEKEKTDKKATPRRNKAKKKKAARKNPR